MDKFRTKLEELLKAVKAAKKRGLPAMPPRPAPEDHPSSIPERDVKNIINKEETDKSNYGRWPDAPKDGGVQDHPDHAPFPKSSGGDAENYGKGTSSDKHSMSSGSPRHHVIRVSKEKQTNPANLVNTPKSMKHKNNSQWSLDKAEAPKKPAPAPKDCTGNGDTCQCGNCRQNR